MKRTELQIGKFYKIDFTDKEDKENSYHGVAKYVGFNMNLPAFAIEMYHGSDYYDKACYFHGKSILRVATKHEVRDWYNTQYINFSNQLMKFINSKFKNL